MFKSSLNFAKAILRNECIMKGPKGPKILKPLREKEPIQCKTILNFVEGVLKCENSRKLSTKSS